MICAKCFREGSAGFERRGRPRPEVQCIATAACAERRRKLAAVDPARLIAGRTILTIGGWGMGHDPLTIELSDGLTVHVAMEPHSSLLDWWVEVTDA